MLCHIALFDVNVCHTNNRFIQMEFKHRDGNRDVSSLFCIYSVFFDAREKHYKLFFHYQHILRIEIPIKINLKLIKAITL